MRAGQCLTRGARQGQHKPLTGFVDILSFQNATSSSFRSASTKRSLKVRIMPKADSDMYQVYESHEDDHFVFVPYAKYRLHGSFKAALTSVPITSDGLCVGNKMAFIHSSIREASRSFRNSRKFRPLKTARPRTIRETQQGPSKSNQSPRPTSNSPEVPASCTSNVDDQEPSILPPLDPQFRLHTSACFAVG